MCTFRFGDLFFKGIANSIQARDAMRIFNSFVNVFVIVLRRCGCAGCQWFKEHKGLEPLAQTAVARQNQHCGESSHAQKHRLKRISKATSAIQAFFDSETKDLQWIAVGSAAP